MDLHKFFGDAGLNKANANCLFLTATGEYWQASLKWRHTFSDKRHSEQLESKYGIERL